MRSKGMSWSLLRFMLKDLHGAHFMQWNKSSSTARLLLKKSAPPPRAVHPHMFAHHLTRVKPTISSFPHLHRLHFISFFDLFISAPQLCLFCMWQTTADACGWLFRNIRGVCVCFHIYSRVYIPHTHNGAKKYLVRPQLGKFSHLK